VKFYYHHFLGMIFQKSSSGEIYLLDSETPEWEVYEEDIPDDAEEITRQLAEQTEDEWIDRFWGIVLQDMSDAEYSIFESS